MQIWCSHTKCVQKHCNRILLHWNYKLQLEKYKIESIANRCSYCTHGVRRTHTRHVLCIVDSWLFFIVTCVCSFYFLINVVSLLSVVQLIEPNVDFFFCCYCRRSRSRMHRTLWIACYIVMFVQTIDQGHPECSMFMLISTPLNWTHLDIGDYGMLETMFFCFWFFFSTVLNDAAMHFVHKTEAIYKNTKRRKQKSYTHTPMNQSNDINARCSLKHQIEYVQQQHQSDQRDERSLPLSLPLRRHHHCFSSVRLRCSYSSQHINFSSSFHNNRIQNGKRSSLKHILNFNKLNVQIIQPFYAMIENFMGFEFHTLFSLCLCCEKGTIATARH